MQVPRYREIKVQVMCIVGQKRETVANFFTQKGYDIPILIDPNRMVIRAFDVFHAFGVDAFRIARPSVFLIRADGKIGFSYVGKNQTDRPPQSSIERTVMGLLNQTIDIE